MKVEPSLWIPTKATGKLFRSDGKDETVQFILRGHQIFTPKSLKLFDCGASEWLSETLSSYQLNDDEKFLQGTLGIAPVDNGLAAKNKSQLNSAEDGQAIVALLKIQLTLVPALECSSCGEVFREPLNIDETLRIQSVSAAGQSQTPKKANAPEAEGDDPTDETGSSNDLLETYVLQKQGLALDAVLLDAIECALPEYPRCAQCAVSKGTD